jgi:UDP-N-acetylmuramate--alanine ligase
MHVFFSGIGGTGIGPLALIAKQAGYEVSGSDASDSHYIQYLRSKGIDNIHIGQSHEQIAQVHAQKPIDWFVYSSALPKTDPNHPELFFCKENNIKATRRDDLLNEILSQKKLKLIAVAGTHGKTTTTAMLVWLFKSLGRPVSYSVGAKISFGEMGQYEKGSEYFIYEADEYDRNFLSFYPDMSVITGLDWDHPDIYPTRESYLEAFLEFIGQSRQVVMWHEDAEKLALSSSESLSVVDDHDPKIELVRLPGLVNRKNGLLAATAHSLTNASQPDSLEQVNKFPGVSRRFEMITDNLYTDYAHTPPKIRGALQLAHELAGENVVVVYEGLHNTRQHFIKDELGSLFDEVKQLYIVPSYLAREDKNLVLLTPDKILDLLSNSAREHASGAQLNSELAENIKQHISSGDLVLCLSAGGAGSLDEWLRKTLKV